MRRCQFGLAIHIEGDCISDSVTVPFSVGLTHKSTLGAVSFKEMSFLLVSSEWSLQSALPLTTVPFYQTPLLTWLDLALHICISVGVNLLGRSKPYVDTKHHWC